MRFGGTFVAVAVAVVLCATRAHAQTPAPPASTTPASPPDAPATPPTSTAPAATPPTAATPAAPSTTPAATPTPPKKSATPETPGRVKVIVLDLKAASLTPAEASAVTGLVTVSLSEYTAFEVVSGADVREMMALEGEKQSLGCEESMSCIAEIAGALGARMVAFGQIEKLGSRYIMNVNLQDTKEGRSRGRIALQGDSLDAIAAAIPDAVHARAETFLTEEHLSTATTSARMEAPKLATTPPSAKPDHGGIAITGVIVGGIGAVLLVGSYLVAANVAANLGASGKTMQDLAGPPIIGAFAAAGDLSKQSGNNGNDPTAVLLPYGAGAGEAVGALAAVGGGVAWAGAEIADGPKLGGAGNAWRWGFIGGGTALVVGGGAFDLLSPTSSNRKLDGADFIAPAAEVAGLVAIGVGVLINPFSEGEP